MRGKIPIKKCSGQRQKIKVRYLVLATVLGMANFWPHKKAQAEGCPDVRIVFARGSGGERWHDSNYLAYKTAIEEKLQTVELSYEFIDIDYPAIGVGVENLSVSLGALFGAGDAYEFGASVNAGVRNLTTMVNGTSCPGTKYVIGGYSQGAMVISKTLGNLDPNKLIYAATFGDPKIYLPEGEGVIPAACKGENLSDYRMYVPDCQAYKGLLGAYIPYEPEALIGKVGTWCNRRDIFCSSRSNITDHVSYVTENLYEDASRVIFDKICKTFEIKNHVSSPHDTAILIDSTGSMAEMIEKYKAEALRLADETLSVGGRVALYDYRDLDDPYQPIQHCDFETCTIEIFTTELEKIKASGGGDTPESLLSASFHVMEELEWKRGSTKSLVVLTDANFLSPDRDGMSFDEVVALSKRIDPVNFYIITDSSYGEYYEDLAAATGGRVVTDFDELSLLTDYILERYDSLPRVEENLAVELPTLEVRGASQTTSETAEINFVTNGLRVLVALNDAVLGVMEVSGDGENTVTISGLDGSLPNTVTLVPLGDDVRGEAITVQIKIGDPSTDVVDGKGAMFIPKAPNTGKC